MSGPHGIKVLKLEMTRSPSHRSGFFNMDLTVYGEQDKVEDRITRTYSEHLWDTASAGIDMLRVFDPVAFDEVATDMS